MDQRDDDNRLDQTYRLLALCARAQGHPAMYEELGRQLEGFSAWDDLPAQAELHGMAPLLWHHIQQAGLSIPAKTAQMLKGLYLRSRIYNDIYTQVLLEIMSLFEHAGIRAQVLKGLALAYEYYPDPALRPFNDIDLLLKRDDVLPALDLLADAGFQIASPHATFGLIPKELKVDAPLRDGIRAHIELHHYDERQRSKRDNALDTEFMGFDLPSHSLLIRDCVIHVPASTDTLNYLLRHLVRHLFEGTPAKPMQLKWVADIVSLVERHVNTWDWDYLRKNDKALIQRLEVFYSFMPMPESIAGTIPIRNTSLPSGFNRYPEGWPQQKIQKWKEIGLLRFLRKSFTPPSVWWLCLYHGINERSAFWYGHIIHPLQTLKAMTWTLFQRTMKRRK